MQFRLMKIYPVELYKSTRILQRRRAEHFHPHNTPESARFRMTLTLTFGCETPMISVIVPESSNTSTRMSTSAQEPKLVHISPTQLIPDATVNPTAEIPYLYSKVFDAAVLLAVNNPNPWPTHRLRL